MLSLHERQLGGRRTPVAASESHFFFLKEEKRKRGRLDCFRVRSAPAPCERGAPALFDLERGSAKVA